MKTLRSNHQELFNISTVWASRDWISNEQNCYEFTRIFHFRFHLLRLRLYLNFSSEKYCLIYIDVIIWNKLYMTYNHMLCNHIYVIIFIRYNILYILIIYLKWPFVNALKIDFKNVCCLAPANFDIGQFQGRSISTTASFDNGQFQGRPI